MNELKKWAYELALCTIVAVVVTLLFYIIRLDRTWEDVSQTFISAFIVVFILGLWRRYEERKSNNNK